MATQTKDPEATETDQSVREQARDMMEKRLAQLQPYVDEFTALKSDVDALHGRHNGFASTPEQHSESAAQSEPQAQEQRPRRGRPPGGRRMEQFLGLVRDNPGITIPQIAKEMDIAPNYLYRLRQQAEEAGTLRVNDDKQMEFVSS